MVKGRMFLHYHQHGRELGIWFLIAMYISIDSTLPQSQW